MPMRPLHWSKVPDAKVAGTLWLEDAMEESKAAVDAADLEGIFGLAETRGRSATKDVERERSGSVEGKAKTKKEQVQLVDNKRSNNISIALARIRLSDEQMRAAVVDPVSHPLTPEQVSAILPALPTAEELEMVKEYTGDVDSLGRVEKFFLVLSDVERLGPRLQALQATQQFAPQWESLADEFKTVLIAVDQVRSSEALKAILRQVLRLGNYLNGTSARGGAYGFKLADLSKLVNVKSADSKTTLLHYLARLLTEGGSLIDDVKSELNALPEAKDIPLSEKRGELAKLSSQVALAKQQLEIGVKEADAMTPLLTEFCEGAQKQLDELKADATAAEEALKKLALWTAEKPSATVEDLFRPLAEFVKAIEKAAQDNAREAEAEKRKLAAAAAPAGFRAGHKAAGKPAGGMPMPGMGGPMGGDKAMQAEIMLKMAQRAEKAAAASGTDNVVKAQREMLAAASAKAATLPGRGGMADVGGELADRLAGGQLFALKRAQAAQAGN